ncbi:hypothetical protein [Kitasatospora sp. NPDC047058]|uniref:hypothetical protein n=1 Tax=Kitasatospora sp. NPDC047058 TaxID=3155620 RepID=UPI003403ECC8
MAAQTQTAGPDVDAGFFKALEKVFDQYPELAGKYAIRWNRDTASDEDRGGPPPDGPYGGESPGGATRGGPQGGENPGGATRGGGSPGAATRAGSFHACCEWEFGGGRWECSHQCEE